MELNEKLWKFTNIWNFTCSDYTLRCLFFVLVTLARFQLFNTSQHLHLAELEGLYVLPIH